MSLAFILGVGLTWVFATTFGAPFAIVFAVSYLILLILFNLFINNTYYTLLYLTLIEKKRIKGLKLK